MQFALFLIFALVALFSVVRADDEKMFDSEGNELEVLDTGLGDQDFGAGKRSFDIRGKNSHRLHSRGRKIEHYTNAPSSSDELVNKNMKVTWYASHDLKNPACGTAGWDPENSAHIGAVSTSWSGAPKCGDFVRICNHKVQRCVRVRVIDQCAGCSSDHVDLTKSAFLKLAPTGSLDEGIVSKLSMYKSNMPNPWDLSLFGPVRLSL